MRRPGRPIGIPWGANARVLAWATDVLTVLMLLVPSAGGMDLVFLLVALGQAWLRAARRNSWGA
jgi:hypothetical protein